MISERPRAKEIYYIIYTKLVAGVSSFLLLLLHTYRFFYLLLPYLHTYSSTCIYILYRPAVIRKAICGGLSDRHPVISPEMTVTYLLCMCASHLHNNMALPLLLHANTHIYIILADRCPLVRRYTHTNNIRVCTYQVLWSSS